jgi:DNA polymerase IIIc chi subunit
MVAINFISVSNKTVIEHLIEMLDALISKSHNVCILAENQEEAESTNADLWSKSLFLPHVLINDTLEAQTSIVVSYNQRVATKNNPTHLIILNKAEVEDINNFLSVDIVFNENSTDIKSYNRERWKNLKNKGFTINATKI